MFRDQEEDQYNSKPTYESSIHLEFTALSCDDIPNTKSRIVEVQDFLISTFPAHNCRYDWLGQCVCAIGEIDVCNCSLDEKKIHWENGAV